MSQQRVLVAGIGNIFMGDDAFGVEVARRLQMRPLPPDVRVVDFGIRGFDLAYALCAQPDATVLIDATPRGGRPGELYVIEPDAAELADGEEAATIEPHGMDPLRVLRLAYAMGARSARVLVVGCEPSPLTEDDVDAGVLGLSEPVQRAIDPAVELVESVLSDLIRDGGVAR